MFFTFVASAKGTRDNMCFMDAQDFSNKYVLNLTIKSWLYSDFYSSVFL
eukprot:UN04730